MPLITPHGEPLTDDPLAEARAALAKRIDVEVRQAEALERIADTLDVISGFATGALQWVREEMESSEESEGGR